MKFEQMASFLEQVKDYVSTKSTHYMLDFAQDEEIKEKMKIIDHFVKWFYEEVENDLKTPRGKDGISYKKADYRLYMGSYDALTWNQPK